MILHQITIKQDKKVVVNTIGEYMQAYILNELEKDTIATTMVKIEQMNKFLSAMGQKLELRLIARHNKLGELVKTVEISGYYNEQTLLEQYEKVSQTALDIAILYKLCMPEEILYDKGANS